MTKVVYISGPMSGVDNWNFEVFDFAAENLRAEGYAVHNPAETFGHDPAFDRSLYMRHDIMMLLQADAVAVLQGWADSDGAKLELWMATQLGIPCYQYHGGKLDDHCLLGNRATWKGSATDVKNAAGLYALVAKEDDDTTPEAEAARLVVGDRQSHYGHPLDDFSKTAKHWSAILGVDVTAEQVALCMIGVKLSRECNAQKRDNLVDAHGYLMTYQMVLDERERRLE